MFRVHQHRPALAIARSVLRAPRARSYTSAPPPPPSPPPPSSRGSSRALLYGAGIGALGLGAYLLQPTRYRGAPTHTSSAPLSPSYFTPATVSASYSTGADSKILELTLPAGALPPSAPATTAPVWSVCIKDDDIQVERAYTPLEGVDPATGRMRLWIKRYPRGEVGRWLHARAVGDTLHLRGPLPTLPWADVLRAGAYDDVLLISGGTGVTPFYQLVHHALLSPAESDSSPAPRFTLLHGARTPADLPPEEIMAPLRTYAAAHPDALRVRLFVDELAGADAGASEGLTVGRVTRDAVRAALRDDAGLADAVATRGWWARLRGGSTAQSVGLSSSEEERRRRTLVVVCGPEPMIAAIAGPYGRNYSQGTIGGILAELGFTSDQVRKL